MTSRGPIEESDEYRKHVFKYVIVKRTRLRTRNGEKREWSLVAKTDIPLGKFIAFYTGPMSTTSPLAESRYAVDMGPGQPTIVPFPDENDITSQQRDRNPLACSNEPAEGHRANMHLIPQDFTKEEVDSVRNVYNHEIAKYFRGLAAFACRDIQAGEQLTWHYGPRYEPIRRLMGYVAGLPCQLVEQDRPFLKDNSASVFESLGAVPAYCVFPVLTNIKSIRFRPKRPARVDSEGEESIDSSSGDHEQAYDPTRRPTRRSKHQV